MNVNPPQTEIQQVLRQARSLLQRLESESDAPSSALADDMLLFCYRLRDNFQIIRSSSKQFRGPSFSFLHGLLYGLESDPDATIQSTEWRIVLRNLLNALVSGIIVVKRI